MCPLGRRRARAKQGAMLFRSLKANTRVLACASSVIGGPQYRLPPLSAEEWMDKESCLGTKSDMELPRGVVHNAEEKSTREKILTQVSLDPDRSRSLIRHCGHGQDWLLD